VDRLRARDEAVFAELLSDWSGSMIRVARAFVSTDASAEDVVQDTWLAVIHGIDRFEGRSSLRTWVYRILVNTAKKRGARESRVVPLASLRSDLETDGTTADPSDFRGPEDEYPGHWRSAPAAWRPIEDSLLSLEIRETVAAALDTLPQRQRAVITLRDVLGHTSGEVCQLLEISAANERVLLHRARVAVRHRLAAYLGADEVPGGAP
jgi:RNA polymerase sigma-70 factor (ECF subfamily)